MSSLSEALHPGTVRNRSPWARTPAALFVVALLTSAWAWWLIAWPVAVLTEPAKHAGHFALVYVHMAGGTLMLVVGAANLYVGWTRRQFRYHRALGYVYLVAGTVGASIAFVLALANTHGGPGVPLAFDLEEVSDVGIALAMLSVAWLAASALAYRAARNRRFETHRAWMIRSYVLTWSFVLCRLVAPVPALASLGDGASIVWLSWIVPLLACEVALQWADTSARRRPASPVGRPVAQANRPVEASGVLPRKRETTG